MNKIYSLLIILGLILLPTLVHADTGGSAFIPPFRWMSDTATDREVPEVLISNITGADMTVTITVWDTDGDIVTDSDDSAATGTVRVREASVTNYEDTLTDGTVTFTLGANDTVRFSLIGTSSRQVGYGLIQWSQSSDAVVGLMASANMIFHDGYSDGIVKTVINNGNPF